jgi:capsular polysaccharide biosynthesis protein
MGVSNRSMINEVEIENIMRAAGFSIMRPETMTFPDQVSVFSSARRIAAPLGAALSNVIFCRDEAEILMIDPGMYDLFFYDLACLRKHLFNWLFSEKIDFSRGSRLHRDYEVDPTLVKETIKFIWQ